MFDSESRAVHRLSESNGGAGVSPAGNEGNEGNEKREGLASAFPESGPGPDIGPTHRDDPGRVSASPRIDSRSQPPDL